MSHEQNECHCTPRLRFPEFDKLFWKHGVLLNFISIISPKYKLPQEKYLKSGDIPIIDQSKQYISGYTNDTKSIISNIVPLIVFGDHTCIVKLIRFPFAQGADGIKIFYGNKEILTEYIYFFINFKPVIMEEYKRHFSILKSKIICYPESKVEQQKIADCLSSLDDLITAHERKRDALQQHKKGLMQRLFPAEGETTPRWRFPEFREAGEWAGTSLATHCDLQAGKFIEAKKIFPQWHEGLFPCYGGNGLRGYVEKSNYKNRYPLIGRQGAFCGNIHMPPDEFYATEHAIVAKCNHLLINIYLFYLLVKLKLNTLAVGQAQPGISVELIKKLLIPFPSLPEQQKIADCLSALDERIAAQEAKIAALREHKKGLMQQLFPQ